MAVRAGRCHVTSGLHAAAAKLQTRPTMHACVMPHSLPWPASLLLLLLTLIFLDDDRHACSWQRMPSVPRRSRGAACWGSWSAARWARARCRRPASASCRAACRVSMVGSSAAMPGSNHANAGEQRSNAGEQRGNAGEQPRQCCRGARRAPRRHRPHFAGVADNWQRLFN